MNSKILNAIRSYKAGAIDFPLLKLAIQQNIVEVAKKRTIGVFDELSRQIGSFEPRLKKFKESEAEYLLYNYLSSIYSIYGVTRQKVLPDGSRIDISILNKYGVEIKLFTHSNKIEVDRAIGQVLGYAKFFDRVVLVIYYTPQISMEDISERFLHHLTSNTKISIITVPVRKF